MPRHIIEVEQENGWTRWVRPVERGYRMQCCDCGLVHELDFRVEDNRVEFRAKRHNRSTAAARRERKRRQMTRPI